MKKIILALSVLFLVQGCEDQAANEVRVRHSRSIKPDQIYLPPNEKLVLTGYGAIYDGQTYLSSWLITREMRSDEVPETYHIYVSEIERATIFEQGNK